MSKNKVVWIVSYPKSGTTWFRAILTGLFSNGDIDINELLEETEYFSTRSYFDKSTSLNSKLMTMSEVYYYRKEFINYIIGQHTGERPIFLQTHEHFHKYKHMYLSSKNSLRIIYIVRNPLSVAVSLSHYLSCSIETAIKRLNSDSEEFQKIAYNNRFPRVRVNWSDHVLSWINNKHVPVEIVRYEDMKNNLPEVINTVATGIGVKFENALIEKCIANSNFQKLKKQEESINFKEKPHSTKSFFRKGETDSWKRELSKNQQMEVIKKHGEVMKIFNY